MRGGDAIPSGAHGRRRAEGERSARPAGSGPRAAHLRSAAAACSAALAAAARFVALGAAAAFVVVVSAFTVLAPTSPNTQNEGVATMPMLGWPGMALIEIAAF